MERISQESGSQAASLEEVKLGIDEIEGSGTDQFSGSGGISSSFRGAFRPGVDFKGLVGKFRLKGMK